MATKVADADLRDSGGVRTVDRALDILFCLGEIGQPAALGEISRRTGLDKATAYRLLRALASRDLVRPLDQPGQYTLGLGILRLTSAVLGGVDPRSVAKPFMIQLRDLTGETVALSILANGERVYIDQVESPHELRRVVRMGAAAPLYAGAASKAILAHLRETEQEEIIARTDFVQFTPNTPSNAARLRAQLKDIRRSGIAVAVGERVVEITGVSSPIFDDTKGPIGALTVCGPSQRLDAAAVERCREPLLAATRKISAQLGYRG